MQFSQSISFLSKKKKSGFGNSIFPVHFTTQYLVLF